MWPHLERMEETNGRAKWSAIHKGTQERNDSVLNVIDHAINYGSFQLFFLPGANVMPGAQTESSLQFRILSDKHLPSANRCDIFQRHSQDLPGASQPSWPDYLDVDCRSSQHIKLLASRLQSGTICYMLAMLLENVWRRKRFLVLSRYLGKHLTNIKVLENFKRVVTGVISQLQVMDQNANRSRSCLQKECYPGCNQCIRGNG